MSLDKFPAQIEPAAWRLAVTADAQAIVELVNRSYRGESARLGWTTETDYLDGQRLDKEILLETLNSGYVLIFEDAKDRHLVGCVNLKLEDVGCYLGMLTVAPEKQKTGLGSFILEVAEKFSARELKCDLIQMTVISLRTELIQWYEARGYQLTLERKPFPYGNERFGVPKRQDLEFVVLNKKLSEQFVRQAREEQRQ